MSEYGKVLDNSFETIYGKGTPLGDAYEEIYGEPVVCLSIEDCSAEEQAILHYFAELGGKIE